MSRMGLLLHKATDMGCFNDSNLMRLLLKKQPTLGRL